MKKEEDREGDSMTIDEQIVEFANEMVRIYGAGHIVSLQEIYKYFEKTYNRNQGSVIPSDYCYNRINNGIQLNKPAVFEYLGNGNYRCYGAGYPFNGTLYHKPKGQNEIAAGKVVNGIRKIAPEIDFQLNDTSPQTILKAEMPLLTFIEKNQPLTTELNLDSPICDNTGGCESSALSFEDSTSDLNVEKTVISQQVEKKKMHSEKNEIKLESKLVGAIRGEFFVPSYQRGYRWGHDEVTRLLEDIYSNGTNNYCLQPVVIRRVGDTFELIDGQQRLTTIFLIYKYMHIASFGFLDEPKFSLTYETRTKSKTFLESIDRNLKSDNIDFCFICNAYETIEGWFAQKDNKTAITNFNKYLTENVKIIWYEVGDNEDSIALFTRLNIGKIALTSAELVKAMFLSGVSREMSTPDKEGNKIKEKQEELSLQWDNIERELQNDLLWFFLTNQVSSKYQTRVDLVLELMAKKPRNSKEKYFAFFYFDSLKSSQSTNDIWKSIQHTFLIIKDWYEDHELYHKIGYLISSESMTLPDIYQLSENKTKSQFKIDLQKHIRNSIKIQGNYSDLSYENANDSKSISKLLLLFNVESVRQNGEQSQWFPFDKYKSQKTGKVSWSLEHIHAQQSEGMRKQEDWKEWLRLHIPSLEAIDKDSDDLIREMRTAIDKQKLDRQEFEDIQQRVIQKLSVQGNAEYLHSIANLALLNTSDNAALSNSTFDVKRNCVIEMDKKGQFIPFCTKMVFLKYYTPSELNQLHFWGQADRDAYISAINDVLLNYLPGEISLEKEQE